MAVVQQVAVAGYKDLSQIGRGGSSTVFKATAKDGAKVAIKILSGIWNEDDQRRFEREKQAMTLLNEVDGIVPLLDSGNLADGTPYLVIPFFEKGSMQDRLEADGPLELEEAFGVIDRLAGILSEVHGRDVFHRDLKPGNLLIDGSDSVWLTDFGMTHINDGRSLSSTAVYTPGYCPPEAFTTGRAQADGRVVDRYGLAATLWALLSGHQPFYEPLDGDAVDPLVILRRVSFDSIGSPRYGVPRQVNKVLDKATAKDPEDRYDSIETFVSELRKPEPIIPAEMPSEAELTVEPERADPETLLKTQSESNFAQETMPVKSQHKQSLETSDKAKSDKGITDSNLESTGLESTDHDFFEFAELTRQNSKQKGLSTAGVRAPTKEQTSERSSNFELAQIKQEPSQHRGSRKVRLLTVACGAMAIVGAAIGWNLLSGISNDQQIGSQTQQQAAAVAAGPAKPEPQQTPTTDLPAGADPASSTRRETTTTTSLPPISAIDAAEELPENNSEANAIEPSVTTDIGTTTRPTQPVTRPATTERSTNLETSSPRPTPPTTAPTPTTASDAVLAQRVRAVVPAGLDVSVSNGVATIEGIVQPGTTPSSIYDAAIAIDGITDVKTLLLLPAISATVP